MIMVEPRLDFDTPRKPIRMLASIYCGKINKKTGVVCGHKIAHVEESRWEIDLASEAELFCDNCKNAYTLADYLHMR